MNKRQSIQMDEAKLSRTILLIVQLLVNGRYQDLTELSSAGSLAAKQMQETVEAWPDRLIMPTDVSLDNLVYDEIIEVSGSNPTEWSVYINLWTKEEGRSDLTLEVTIYDNSSEYYGVRIDNIHVL